MNLKLSREIRTEIDDFCKRFSIDQDLDPELQEELRGHIEDAIFQERSSDKSLSEQEAFAQALRKFGDTQTVQESLEVVHNILVPISPLRRLVAITSTTIALNILLSFSMSITTVLPFLVNETYGKQLAYVHAISIPFVLFALTLFQLGLLRRWNARGESSQCHWFQRYDFLTLLVILLVLLTIKLFIPTPHEAFSSWEFESSTHARLISVLVIAGALLIQATTWIWWTTGNIFRKRIGILASLAWLFISILPWHALHLIDLRAYAYSPDEAMPQDYPQFVLWDQIFTSANGESSIAHTGVLRFNPTSENKPWESTIRQYLPESREPYIPILAFALCGYALHKIIRDRSKTSKPPPRVA